jgi:glycolate oxidase iron-sulfur subunit
MQTNFTLRQLHDPDIVAADDILRRCVHCGFCTATCPTYVLLGDERDSPRGRIYLMKEMFESGEVTEPVVTHLDRCLTCLSCMTTCPSGVDYMHLVDLARAKIDDTIKRPWHERLNRWFLGRTLPDPRRFRFVLLAGWLARPLKPILEKLNFYGAVAALNMVPKRFPRLTVPARHDADARHRVRVARVAMLRGCVQENLAPSINDAAVRLLERHGVEVVFIEDQFCCGALEHHLGQDDGAREKARRNIDAWSAQMRERPLDAILVTASGCGTMVKDYGTLLAGDHGYAERAAEIAYLAQDISEFMEKVGLAAPAVWTNLTVAYQSPCSLQHGQGIDAEPRELLAQAGFRVVDLPENHLCCGSAGTYSLMQPKLSAELRDRKCANIASVAPDIVATGNIGCLSQLMEGSPVPVIHTVELLDWATGGPCPKSIEALKERAKPVKSLLEQARV